MARIAVQTNSCSIMMIILQAILLALLAACAPQRSDVYIQHYTGGEVIPAVNDNVTVKLDFGKPIIVRGIAANNETANTTQILYSGDAGVVGFLAQIAAHSAVSSSMETGRLSEQQLKANKVLKPLHGIIGELTQQALVHASERYTFANIDQDIAGLVLESYPVFYVSSDLKSITLKHLVKIYKNKDHVIYQNEIQVTSHTLKGHGPDNGLNLADGTLFESVLRKLYKSSLRLAMSDASGDYKAQNSKRKTYKYHQGGQLKVERGFEVARDQDLIIIRNLRGWLLEFPDEEIFVERDLSSNSQ